MKLSSWPESLLWMHYVHAQTAAAACGLIGPDLLALTVEIGEESVALRAVVSEPTDDVVEDLEEICFSLDVLLGGHAAITSEISVGFGPVGSWPPPGANRLYVAKGAHNFFTLRTRQSES